MAYGTWCSAARPEMFNLDVRSVILVSGALSLLMATVLYFLRRSFPSSIRGLGEWAAAPAIIFVATLLFGARGAIHDLFSVVLANLLLLGGSMLMYFGSQRFFNLAPSIRPWSALILLALLPLTWFALVQPHYGVRVAMVGGLMSLIALVHARLILRHGTRTFSSYFTGGALLLLVFSQGMRCLSAFDLAAGDRIFDNNLPTQTAYVALNAFAILMTTIGMVLMATDKLRAEIEYLASHDTLTGALSRRVLIDACEQELERCRRKGHRMSLLMLDLDNFKAINDAHGHLVGDRALVDFTIRAKAALRRPDRFGRYGGEEFVALLPETSLEEALVVAERIRAAVENSTAEQAYTVSVGVAGNHADDTTVDAVLSRADTALYAAKAAGRNCVRPAA